MFNTRSVPRRAIALCACLLPPGLLTGCGGGSSSSVTTPVNTGPVTSATRTYNNLQFTLSADRAVYTANEKPVFTFTVKNIGAQTVNLNYSSGATFRFNISQNSQLVSIIPSGGSAGVLTSDALTAGETKTFNGSWDRTVETTGQNAPTGSYTVTAWLPAGGLNGIAVSAFDAQTSLNANPITIQIQ